MLVVESAGWAFLIVWFTHGTVNLHYSNEPEYIKKAGRIITTVILSSFITYSFLAALTY